tara:strand:+ start:268 stop:591 length:324 start_codon:yes stop_codon:yes gene_type:complete
MKTLKLIVIFIFIFSTVTSCGTVKEGFSMQKKNNSDEFLVEKKSPLLMPPNFNELPIPKTDSVLNSDQKNQIKQLITNSEESDISSENDNNTSGNFEKLLLGKIKQN